MDKKLNESVCGLLNDLAAEHFRCKHPKDRQRTEPTSKHSMYIERVRCLDCGKIIDYW